MIIYFLNTPNKKEDKCNVADTKHLNGPLPISMARADAKTYGVLQARQVCKVFNFSSTFTAVSLLVFFLEESDREREGEEIQREAYNIA